MASPLHVVGCSDTNFSIAKLRPFFTALRKAHPGEELFYHYLTVGATAEFRNGIAEHCAAIGLPIAFHEVGDQVAAAFAGGVEENTKWTLAIYGRLFMAEVLPPDVERAVYMDFDTLCLGNLRELLAQVQEGETVAAALNLPDLCSAGRRDYFNAGVLVVPVAAWRKDGVAAQLAKLFLAMKREGRPLPFYDQDLLNAHFAGRIHEIPLTWNAQAFVDGAGGCVPADIWKQPGMARPKLVHYAGVTKPWASPTTWMAFPRPAALAYAKALVDCAAPGVEARRRVAEMTIYRLLSLGSLELRQGSFRMRMAYRLAEVAAGRESPFCVFRWLAGAFSRRSV